MNVLVIIPFPITNDILIDKEVYKVCKTKFELQEAIKNANEDEEQDHLILSYLYPSNYKYHLRKFDESDKKITDLYISDLYGTIVKLKEEDDFTTAEEYILNDQYSKYDSKKYPSPNDIIITVFTDPEKNYEYRYFTKDFRFQLMSEFFNYFVSKFIEKIDIGELKKKESSIFSYTDLFKYLINTKYPFLGHISVIIQQIPYETQYDDFFENSNIKDFPTIYTVKKYNTNKTISKMKEYFDDFSAKGVGSLSWIENYYFITSNGYKMNISKNGELSITRDLSEGLSSNAKMILD